MKIIDCEQGSGDWFRARIGLPTASCFDQIITPKKGEYSKSARKYAYKLVCERLLNQPLDSVEGTDWMVRGKEMEPLAVKQYEWVTEYETLPVGFITTDDGMVGASPDRLIKGKPAAVEIKCPAPHTQLAYLLDGHDEAYRPQVQGQLYVTEFDFIDWYSYHPLMPGCHIRTGRDEEYIVAIHNGLVRFNEELAVMLERARELGVFQAMQEVKTPLDLEMAAEVHADLERDVFGLPPIS